MADLIANVLKNPTDYLAFLRDLQAAWYIDDSVDVGKMTAGEATIAINDWVSLRAETISAVVDQTIMYKVIADPKITFTMVEHMGLNLGRFKTGKLPFMMFGLPAAAAAMWFSVPKENRKQVMGIYFSAVRYHIHFRSVSLLKTLTQLQLVLKNLCFYVAQHCYSNLKT